MNPRRLAKSVHFLPDPVLDADGTYKSFEDVYGTETDDSDRPSLKGQPLTSERDKQFKKVFVSGMLE